MEFRWHLLVGIWILILYPIYGLRVVLTFLSSLAIDLDHIYLVIKEKAFSLKKLRKLEAEVYTRHKKRKDAFNNVFFIFHTAEFNILLLVASFFYPFLFYISAGFIFHIVCDIVHNLYFNVPIKRWIFLTDFIRRNAV